MKYDPIELMKLNMTEEGIQRRRDQVLKGLTVIETKYVEFVFLYIDLPFIIDMFDGFEVSMSPFVEPGIVNIRVRLLGDTPGEKK